MGGEVRSVVALAVAMQFVANLQTFPFIVELMLAAIAVLLGGMQALAHQSDDYRPARPLISAMLALLGWAVLAWSVYKLATSLGSTQWDTIGKSFALAFWLPAAVLPANCVAAVAMQHDSAMRVMKHLGSIPLRSRLDFCRHHRLNLRRLNAFASTGHMHDYARASSRKERLAILRLPK